MAVLLAAVLVLVRVLLPGSGVSYPGQWQPCGSFPGALFVRELSRPLVMAFDLDAMPARDTLTVREYIPGVDTVDADGRRLWLLVEPIPCVAKPPAQPQTVEQGQ